MKHLIVTGTLGLILTACNHTTSGVNMDAPPTASSGYATINSSFSDSDNSVTRTAQLQNLDWNGTGKISQKNVTVRVSATGNIVNGENEYVMTYDGIRVKLTWNIANGRYEGINGNLEIWASTTWATKNGQLVLSWINLIDHSGAIGDTWGFTATGFNSDPTVVAARSGSATFKGWGGVSLNARNNSFWTAAEGVAKLTADFKSGTVKGTIDLVDNGNGFGGAAISNTTLTLNPMSIGGNTFAGTASINAADFGLSSIGAISVDGMFYEAKATGVGGDISGVGTAKGTGLTTFLNGAFVANE